MAEPIKTAEGTWRIQVYVKGVRAGGTFETKAEARNWAAAKRAELLTAKKVGAQTLTQAIDRYSEEVSTKKAGAEWEARRLKAFARDFAALCSMRLADITTADMAAWRDARLASVTPGTVQREINLISNIFAVARDEWRWITDTPLRGLRPPGDNPPRVEVWRWQDIKRMCRWFGYVTGRRPDTKTCEIAHAFLIALRTGMRSGEILSLSDDSVNLASGVVTVKHKMQYLTKRPRQIPLRAPAIRLLRVLSGHGQFFTIGDASRDTMFRKAVRSLMLPNLHFHDARGTALTLLARKVDVLTLSRISGIKDISLLSRVYWRESAEQISARLRKP